jgi:hypothetical protein
LSGVSMLASSAIAGFLWDRAGSAVTFYAGAGFAAFTLAGVLASRLRGDTNASQLRRDNSLSK